MFIWDTQGHYWGQIPPAHEHRHEPTLSSSFNDSRQIQQLNVGSFVLKRKWMESWKLFAGHLSCPKLILEVHILWRLELEQAGQAAQSSWLCPEANSMAIGCVQQHTQLYIRSWLPKASHDCSWIKQQKTAQQSCIPKFEEWKEKTTLSFLV